MDFEKVLQQVETDPKDLGPYEASGRFVYYKDEPFAVIEAGGDPREEESRAKFTAAALNLGDKLGKAVVKAAVGELIGSTAKKNL